jgi:tRNA pseudouridine38-40 synthase
VRRMVGAAVACALGKSHLRDLQRDLEQPTAEAQLRWAALAAPASGLFLEHVQYQSDDEPGPLVAVSRVP